MSIGAQLINRVIGIRLLVTLLLLAMAAGFTPKVVERAGDAIDTFLLQTAIDFIDYPRPNTSITVVHVPDVEYEAWLADIAGTDSFYRLLQKAKVAAELETTAADPTVRQTVNKPVFALIAEQPLMLIQGRAEKLVAAWAQQARIKPAALMSDLKGAVKARNSFVVAAKENLVVGGGVVSGAEHTKIPVQPVDLTAELDFAESWLSHLWPIIDESYREIISSSPIQQFLLPAPGLVAPLLVQGEDAVVYESFLLRLLRLGTDGARGVMTWQQGTPVVLGGKTLAISFDGSVVPLYGNAVGVTAPVAQLTLAAALRADNLKGWVLIGRDQSAELQNTAQILSAINDGAYLTQPVLTPLLKWLIYIVLLMACFIVLPRLSVFSFVGFFTVFAAGCTIAQLSTPYFAFYWLPMGDVLAVMGIVFLLMLVWRVRRQLDVGLQKKVQKLALMSARLSYHDGHYVRALKLIKQVPLDKHSLKYYYKIADALLGDGAVKEALPVWRLLNKRAATFKQVKQKLVECESALQVPVATVTADQTQVIAGAGVSTGGALEKLGRYHVRSVLGHGGSGIVYEGFDPVITRDVALKTLNLNVFSSQNQSKVNNRFLAEVKTVGKLNHPNIVSVFDVGKQENWAYIAMDLARGQPLTDYVTKGHLLPVAEVYWIGLKVAEALAFAHQHKIVHCDIKPGNIIYNRETFDVKVTDFGIAKWLDAAHTETGEIMGSPLYMAPEQLKGHSVVAQTDIFSLGATLHQLLCGSPPFDGRSIAEIQQAVLYARPESVRTLNKALPASAARIVNRALKKKTTERFSSASDMAFTLNKAIIRDFKDEAKNWRLL
ncbi:serine/threonine-protein kinase [Marinagarivorans algicola]|uniref:serine/threonine-protein kinase n=1 Tax=Marinagarivorans algicola TaxID=1513270 RepID=UPI0006B958E9|nr:serine/threonine-protein kinase [Marinagarivorans algicola]